MNHLKSCIVLVSLVIAVSCGKDDDDGPSKTELLTAGSSKNWNLTDTSPENEEPGCRPTTDRVKDNTWTFFKDGTFKFDHGLITEGDPCSDARNITGTWEFKENETILEVVTAFDTDDPDNTFEDIMISGTIKSLTATTLVLQTSPGEEVTFSVK